MMADQIIPAVGQVLSPEGIENIFHGGLSHLSVDTATGTAAGTLTDVTLVRRSDTQAGVPTMGCDAVHQNNEVRVPYQATYSFYTTTPSATK